MNKEKVEAVQKVLDLLNDESKWCKRTLCQDKDKNRLYDSWDEKATSWCLMGALLKTETCDLLLLDIYNEIKIFFSFRDGISQFNDSCEYEDIIEVLENVKYKNSGFP